MELTLAAIYQAHANLPPGQRMAARWRLSQDIADQIARFEGLTRWPAGATMLLGCPVQIVPGSGVLELQSHRPPLRYRKLRLRG